MLRKTDLLPLLFLLLAVLFFFGDLLWTDRTFFTSDLLTQVHPWRTFTAERLKEGQAPLWDPSPYCGMPHAANPQAGVFYPLNLIFLFLPHGAALKLFIGLHFFLAGSLMVAFLRQWRVGKGASLIGGLAYAFGSFMTLRLEFPGAFAVAAWVPGVLTATALVMRKRTTAGFLTGALLTALLILSGHPELSFYAVLLMLSLCLLDGREGAGGRLLSAAGLLAAGTLLAALMVLPALEMVSQSSRAAAGILSPLPGQSFPLRQLVTLVFPYFFLTGPNYDYWGAGMFWLDHFYAGLLPFLLAVFAVTVRGDRRITFLSLVLLAGLVLAAPASFPYAAKVLSRVPPFSVFRHPAQAMLLWAFALPALAALGADDLIRERARRTRFLWITGIAFVLAGVVWLALSFGESRVWLTLFRGIEPGAFHLRCATVLHDARHALTVLIVIAAVFHLFFRTITDRRSFILLAAVITVADLLPVDISFHRAQTEGLYTAGSETAAAVTRHPGFFRIFSQDPTSSRYPDDPAEVRRDLYPNIPGTMGLYNAEGYDPLQSDASRRLLRALKSQRSPTDSGLLDLLGVRYLLSDWPLNARGLREVERSRRILYENRTALPRAFMVRKVFRVLEEKDVWNVMVSRAFRPSEEAITTGSKTELFDASRTRYRRAHVSEGREGFQTLSFDTELDGQGLLVVTDAWAPGWKVFVDGRERPIHKVDGMFRGVMLQNGDRRVVFRYEPVRLKAGLAVSLLGLLVVWGLGWIWSKRGC